MLIAGKNGSGKSSLLKVLFGQHSQYKGKVEISPQLMVGYVAQDASQISGTFKEFAQDQHLDVTHFLMLLRKLGFAREQFEKIIRFECRTKEKSALSCRFVSTLSFVYF